MKINIFTGPMLPIPPVKGGAVQRRWQGVAEEFAKCHHEVTIFTRSYHGQASEQVINGVSYVRLGGFDQSNNVFIDLVKDFFYAKKLLKALPSSDVLIINDFWLPILIPKKHNFGLTVANAARYPKKQYNFYSNVSAIVTVSKPIKNAIVKQTPRITPKTYIIPNPINNAFFHGIHQNTKKKEKTILYVGRIHPEKGIGLLISAFTEIYKQIKNIKLVIVGPWMSSEGGGGVEFFEKLKYQAGDEVPVEFIGPIFDLEKLATVYANADIFCYPSLAEKGEAFGVAPLEAMASGLIPIVSGLECFLDFISPNINGFTFDHRTEKRKENLIKVLEEVLFSTDIINIKKNAIDTAMIFSYENVASQYLNLFEKLSHHKIS